MSTNKVDYYEEEEIEETYITKKKRTTTTKVVKVIALYYESKNLHFSTSRQLPLIVNKMSVVLFLAFCKTYGDILDVVYDDF